MTYSGIGIAMGVVALAATLVLSGLTLNQFVRRKLALSSVLLAGYLGIQLVLALNLDPDLRANLIAVGRLAYAAAIINALVVVFINPLRVDRVPDRFPTILQDFIVIGLLLVVATFVFHDKLLTTSAVSAVVIGFALQDTLGNAFAGLAIQSEKPFNIGHWIRVGDFEGRVAEVTWRATKLRTKTGNFVVVPNNIVSKEAITNYSEPAAPTRLEVEIGASYLAAPNVVKSAIAEALSHCTRALKAPAPGNLLRVPTAQHRNPMADSGPVREELEGPRSRRAAAGA
jgi:small-conductance mechanosensitive channel